VHKEEIDEGNPIEDDIIVEDPPSPNPTSNTMDPIPGTETSSSEHKKLGNSASTGSVAALKRKRSTDTIKTVTSSSTPMVVVDVPLVKQLPPTSPSSNIHSSPPQQQQLLPFPLQVTTSIANPQTTDIR
jgi:hypothetical protein